MHNNKWIAEKWRGEGRISYFWRFDKKKKINQRNVKFNMPFYSI